MTELLTALSLIFIAVGSFVLLAHRLRLPIVPLLIIAGLVVGNVIDEQITIELARYGIALLVFVFGARIQFDAVRVVLGDSELVALGQIFLIGGAGLVVGIFAGIPIHQSVFLGIAAALSSTIVGTSLIRGDIRENLVRGRLAESIHYVQDIVAIAMLLILGAQPFGVAPVLADLFYGALFLLVALVSHRYVFRAIEWLSGGSDEAMLVGVIGLLVAFLGAAEFVGISIIVGAFAAGLAVPYDPVRHLGVFNGLESIRDFFVAIFFVTVGALVTYPSIEVLLIAFLLVILTTILKPIVTLALLIRRGYEARSATLTSLNIDQVSEFSLIIAIEGLLFGVLEQAMFDAIILAAAVTMITSGLTQAYDERIYRVVADRGLITGQHGKIDARSDIPSDLEGHVVIIGFGRQGRRLARRLEELDQSYVIVENDPIRLDKLRAASGAYVFGDAMEPYTWEKAKASEARIVVSTVDSFPVSARLLSLVRETDVIVRARESTSVAPLLERGARYVYVDDTLAGRQLIDVIDDLEAGEISRTDLRERYRRLLLVEGESAR